MGPPKNTNGTEFTDCPDGYIPVDYDNSGSIGTGECWRGMVVNDDSGNVGIGTTTPDTLLHVEGPIKMVDGNQADGLVMTSDSKGVGSWQALPTLNIWSSSANGTGGIDYYITGSNVGIGTASPDYTLTVDGIMGILGGDDGTDTYHTIFQGSGSQGSDITYTLPSTPGSAGTVLTDTGGDGILSWETVVNGVSATYTDLTVTNSLTIPGHNVKTATDRTNTLLGYNAGNSTMIGAGNTAFGNGVLSANTTGSNNTATGFGSLYSNDEGFYNTATGYHSLYFNTTGDNNTATGLGSL